MKHTKLEIQQRPGWIWGWVMLALVAYTLPWLANRGVGLTFGAYDLAEWASLHPDVRAGALVTSLLLRVQPALLAVMIALNAPRPAGTTRWWLSTLSVVLIALALLPPLEFFRAWQDPNHRQQAGIAAGTLLLGGIGLSGIIFRWRRYLAVGVLTAGILTSGIGLFNTYQVLQVFDLPETVGWGMPMLMGLYGLALIAMMWSMLFQRATKQGGT